MGISKILQNQQLFNIIKQFNNKGAKIIKKFIIALLIE